jgi:hypothetical protein
MNANFLHFAMSRCARTGEGVLFVGQQIVQPAFPHSSCKARPARSLIGDHMFTTGIPNHSATNALLDLIQTRPASAAETAARSPRYHSCNLLVAASR